MQTVNDFRMPPHTKYRDFPDEEVDPTFVRTREVERARYARRPMYGAPPPSVNAPVGAWTALEVVLRLWYWILLTGFLGTVGGYFAGTHFFKSGYVASVEMMRHTFNDQNAAYQPRDFSEDGFVKLMKSREILERVSPLTQPRLLPKQLSTAIDVKMNGESEMFTISAIASISENAFRLANLYASNAVVYAQELQRQEANELVEVLKQQLAFMDEEAQTLNRQLRDIQTPRGPTPSSSRVTALRENLDKAEQELLSLKSRYTDRFPLVAEAQAKRDLLAAELQKLEQKTANEAPTAIGPDPDVIRNKLVNLDHNRQSVVGKQQEAEVFVKNPPGYAEIFAPAELKDVREDNWKMKVLLATVIGGITGLLAGLLLVLIVEVFDERIKTTDDLKRVTSLPLLATLGNVRKMNEEAQANWAFRTWTALQCQLKVSPNHGVVCGITSSAHDEGRSTWINLLSQAAGQCGFRVLTIGTVRMPEGEDVNDWFAEAEEATAAGPAGGEHHSAAGNGVAKAPQENRASSTSLMRNMLTTPSQVTQKLVDADAQTFVHIPLPGWVWNLERRKQWQGALSQWKKIENVVIFVELPPASMPEAVLLAQKLPNVIWLARSGKARAWHTRNFVQTLRDARCNLVGCVLNGSSKGSIRRRFARWTSAWMTLASLTLGLEGVAQEPALPPPPVTPQAAPVVPQPAPAEVRPAEVPSQQPGLSTLEEGVSITNFSFSATDRSRRAEWQKRLTLGPGDVLNISLFGQPDLDRKEVAIGPDGRLNYLQAIEMPAAGLTVDELRERLDQELAKYYRTPRTVVVPVTFRSKKYYVLGKVNSKGVYSLDRPLTVVEAVARAHGLETGLIDNNNITEIADLQRSFLMRNGQRLKVNFERLFQEGDLSQNVALEPNDFLFFASGALKEVYVLGEVRSPGPYQHTASTTVMTAIANRGGFTDRAYKSRIVVIRGSLNKPQKFIVDVGATVDARGLDFKLEPKDIVYVHYRPFIYVEDLLDLAASAFAQSVVSAWAGKNVGPIIKEPIF